MSSVLKLHGVPDVRLAPPPRPGSGGRPVLRRRAALGLALLVLAVLFALVAAGTIHLPGAWLATAVPGRPAPPRADASEAEPQPRAAPHASEARPAPDRVVASTRAKALFAQHSWLVLKPAPPPPPPEPPPPPAPATAPPFPYTFVGSLAPKGERPVFFLARGDRVIDARVGDRLDGVYQFESAAGGQLVFVYLPLDIRHTLAAGASK